MVMAGGACRLETWHWRFPSESSIQISPYLTSIGNFTPGRDAIASAGCPSPGLANVWRQCLEPTDPKGDQRLRQRGKKSRGRKIRKEPNSKVSHRPRAQAGKRPSRELPAAVHSPKPQGQVRSPALPLANCCSVYSLQASCSSAVKWDTTNLLSGLLREFKEITYRKCPQGVGQ